MKVPTSVSEAEALFDQTRLPEAEAACRKILGNNAGDARALRLLGAINLKAGLFPVAAALFRRALAAEPGSAANYCGLGEALQGQGQWEQAKPCFREALSLDESYRKAHHKLGVSHLMLGQVEDAERCFDSVVALGHRWQEGDRLTAKALDGLAVGSLAEGRQREAVEYLRRAVAVDPESTVIHSHLLFALHYEPSSRPEDLLAEARAFGIRHAASLRVETRPHLNSRDLGRRLRVGYVSGDFLHHSVGHLLEPVLRTHDQAQVEVFCYATNNVGADDVTARLRSDVNNWRNIAHLTDEVAAEIIRRDMIDILIDLSGHTAGGRPLLFARKPAPVQATWLGYFGSTGITAIDYLFADAHMVAPEEDSFYAEKVVRLPAGWWCFRPPTDHDSARCEPATSRNGYVTFGCFNNVAKITPEVVGVWARIMRALPDSRILLKNAAFDSPRVHARYADLFAAHGVDTQRVHFAGRSPYADYLAAYAEIDIALDPFPFNGGMTSIEGLWMGVPMVTFRGDRFTSRFGAALLTEVGLKDLIARSDDEYVARAVALARDVERLAGLRGGLRGRMMLSRICDVQGFTRGLEETYRELWARWCAEASED